MTERKGIDVSEWNDNLKYSEIAKEIEFVIPREGYRCRRDHLFLDHVKGFQAAGVKVPGVYHFIYAVNEYEAREEAKSCIKNVKVAGLPDSITIWSDMEYDSIDKAEATRGIILGPPEVNRITRAFLEEIAAAGYRCGIYTNLDFYRNWYNSSMLSSFPLWFAQYTDAKKPAVDDCEIWQYSSKGVIAGANLDLDIWYDKTEKKPGKKPEQKPAAKITAGEKACRWMESAAKDPTHGYDQRYRWGEKGDYDCSSAIIQAVEESGILVKTAGATYTGNIARVFKMLGFRDVTSSVNLATGKGLLRSDILLNHRHHVAMYCGNGLEVEASINERGTATGGTPGDQTGKEFLIRPYRNFPWDCVLRFPDVTDKTEGETGTNTKPGGLSTTPRYVACVTASRLNVRTWAGTEYPKIKSDTHTGSS